MSEALQGLLPTTQPAASNPTGLAADSTPPARQAISCPKPRVCPSCATRYAVVFALHACWVKLPCRTTGTNCVACLRTVWLHLIVRTQASSKQHSLALQQKSTLVQLRDISSVAATTEYELRQNVAGAATVPYKRQKMAVKRTQARRKVQLRARQKDFQPEHSHDSEHVPKAVMSWPLWPQVHMIAHE